MKARIPATAIHTPPVTFVEIFANSSAFASRTNSASMGPRRRRVGSARTPGPPQFSSMNSTPADSNARRTRSSRRAHP